MLLATPGSHTFGDSNDAFDDNNSVADVMKSDGSPLVENRSRHVGSNKLQARLSSGRLGPVNSSTELDAQHTPAAVQAQQRTLLGPRRPPPTKVWTQRFVKLLVVGDSGIGKTTLIKTLLSTAGEALEVHDGTATPLSRFKESPESLITTLSWEDSDDRKRWVFQVQDTPGYGDGDIRSHIAMMLRHIRDQNLRWLQQERAPNRTCDPQDAEDPRIDAIIYCLPPHRLRQNDVRYMHALGKAVPIIPVIMKADTMTLVEAQRFRQEVANVLQNPTAPGINTPIKVVEFSPHALTRAHVRTTPVGGVPPPFVVVASNYVDSNLLDTEQDPIFWPERPYPWGTAQAFNPQHSDLLSLRALVLTEAVEELGIAKRRRYEAWRARELRSRRGRNFFAAMRRLIVWTVLPVTAAALAVRHNYKGSAVIGAAANGVGTAAATAVRQVAQLRWFRRRGEQEQQQPKGGAKRSAHARAAPVPSKVLASAHHQQQHQRPSWPAAPQGEQPSWLRG